VALTIDKITYYLLLLFSFLLPISRASDTIFTIYFSLFFFIYIIFNYKKCLLLKDRFFHIIMAFIAYILISILWSSNQKLGAATHYLQWFAIFGLAIYISKHIQIVDKLLTFFLAGMLISEILSYGIYFGLWSINGKDSTDPTPFMMHIDYSIYIAFAALILLNRLFSNRYTIKEKIFMAIFFVTMSGNLFINGGRTGQLAFILALIVSFFIHFRFNVKNLITVLMGAFLLIGIAFYSSKNFQIRTNQAIDDIKLMQKNNYNSSWGLRLYMWKIGSSLFKENPILGSGINSQKDLTKKYLQDNPPKSLTNWSINVIKNHHLHSQYIQTLVELGIVGIAFIIAIFYQIFKFKIIKDEFRELKYIFIVIFLVGFLPEPLFLKQFTNILFIFFISILYALDIYNKRRVC